MTVSIIIPVYNEEKTIGALLDTLAPIKDKAEILFVDGGSSDKTRDLIPQEYTVLTGVKGRARQMNYGAECSHGDVIFFLHCDSVLPEHAIDEIEEVMKTYQVGCFGVKFPSKHPWMLYCRIMSNRRARKGIVFGDQGIFIKRELLFEQGGFPDMPIMEDYQFSLDLKAKNILIGMTKNRICTSDRRFKKGGRWRTMCYMRWLRRLYRNGTDIEKIAQLYKDIR